MNDLQLVERLAGTDAFPAEAPLPESLRRDVVLLEIERRKTMDTLERTTTPAPPPQSRWRNAALAGLAAVVVILIGVTAAWLTSRTADEPAVPSTTVPATGALSDPTPAEFSYVSSMGVDLTNADPTRVLASLLDGTEFPVTGPDQPIRSEEDLEDFLTYGIALGSTWQRGVCTMGADGIATCELIRFSDEFDPYAGVDTQVMLVHLALDGDRATSFAIEFTGYGTDNWQTREREFMVWLEDTHPEDYEALYLRPTAGGVWAPDWSDPIAAAELVKLRVPEFLAANG